MICLHQINSAYWSLYSLFPRLCAHIYMYIQHCNHRSQSSPSLFRVANGGPAAAHVWRGCCGFWEPGHKGPKLGLTASMRQKDVVMMSPLVGVVQKPYPQNTGDILLKITYNRFPLCYVIGLYNIHFYWVKIGWKLIRTSMCFVLSGKRFQRTDLWVERLPVVEIQMPT